MNEVERTFSVSVKITKDTPGDLLEDLNFEVLIKKIKDGIEESCNRTMGVINSYIVGEVTIDEEDSNA